MNFAERFKNKASFIGKQGIIDVEGSAAVSKPLESQVYGNYKKNPLEPQIYEEKYQKKGFDSQVYEEYQKKPFESQNIIEKYSNIDIKSKESYTPSIAKQYETLSNLNPIKSSEPFDRKQPQSAKPFRPTEIPPRNELKTSQKSKIEDYKPYTLQDYLIIKSDKYYELGGLGPSNIGSEEWKQRKEKMDKKILYAKQVKIANSSLPPSHQRKPKDIDKDVSKREKANQFARMIPRPTPKPKNVKNEEVPALTSVLDELEKQHFAYKASIDAIKSGIK